MLKFPPWPPCLDGEGVRVDFGDHVDLFPTSDERSLQPDHDQGSGSGAQCRPGSQRWTVMKSARRERALRSLRDSERKMSSVTVDKTQLRWC